MITGLMRFRHIKKEKNNGINRAGIENKKHGGK